MALYALINSFVEQGSGCSTYPKKEKTKMDKDTNFATELLTEVKHSSRRWFIAFIVTLALWFATIGGFLWYISLPVDETTDTTVTQDAEDSGTNNFAGGDIVNGKTGD